MLRALVFDFDGLIIDSETAVAGAWREVFASHGHPLPEDLWRSMVGTRENDGVLWAELTRLTGLPFEPQVHDPARRQRGIELSQALQTLPGVVPLLDEAARRGLSLAVASSSSDWWVQGHLERLGLSDRFSVVCTKGDAPRSKPFPDIYLEALRRLGVEAREAVAFEDSAPGVSAAKAAGMTAVAVPGSYTEHMTFDHADRVMTSLADVPADALLDDLAQRLG